MEKALKLLDVMYTQYEKNIEESGRECAIPRVSIKDWQDACIGKKLYRRNDNFKKALNRMVDRNLVYLDENEGFVYAVSIYLKYFQKEDFKNA
jgi:hypothetical protein